MVRSIVQMIFVVVLALASIRPAAAEPQVTVACYGATCNGVDPYAAGCVQDAKYVSRGGYILRYYSPRCNAYFGWISGYANDVVYIWMSPNQSATYNEGLSYTYSKMWASGLACTSYAAYPAYCV